MKNIESLQAQLIQLGFEESFITEETRSNEPFSYARIIEVNRGNYKISKGKEESLAELSGKFLFNVESSLDYPTVGDWVLAQFFGNSVAIIHTLLPRKSLMKRLDPGKSVEFQLIAANIDYAFIVQSVNANFDLNRLERYLVMVNESGINPIILLTKTDLISQDELSGIYELLEKYKEKYPVYAISSLTGDGLDLIEKLLTAGKTYSLLGSSGVGKTTLINTLVGKQEYDVNEIREKDDKGKHTTTRRQLITLDSGAIIIDTPGMRELGNFAVEKGVEETFDVIMNYASRCRFKDCTHTNDKGCAVLKAVKDGELSHEQYHNFMKIQKEAAFYEMSAQEKRQKDRKFGAFRKKVVKNMRKK